MIMILVMLLTNMMICMIIMIIITKWMIMISMIVKNISIMRNKHWIFLNDKELTKIPGLNHLVIMIMMRKNIVIKKFLTIIKNYDIKVL